MFFFTHTNKNLAYIHILLACLYACVCAYMCVFAYLFGAGKALGFCEEVGERHEDEEGQVGAEEDLVPQT